MKPPSPFNTRLQQGFALVVVLAFVVLLTGLMVAYFSRSMTDRELSNSSFNQTKSDQLARSALEMVVGDLKEEIVTGSNAMSAGNSTIYTPQSNANMVPARSGNPGTPPFSTANPDPIPNLIRRSVRNDAIPSPAVGSRASAISSETDLSSNGRFVSKARWNQHYLIPRSDFGTKVDSTPNAGSNFTAPDWVLVSRSGPKVRTIADLGTGPASINNALSTNTNYVVGRYAYAIYDEGGLLDMNVAGYPGNDTGPPSSTGLTQTQIGQKGSIALADLTEINLPQDQTNQIVGWRNYATGQPPSGSFNPSSAAARFAFTTPTATQWLSNFVTANTTGFLKASLSTWNGRTDQMFLSRQQLLGMRSALGFTQNALHYIGTFSRAVNAPSWRPTANSQNMVGYIAGAGTPIAYKDNADIPSSINRNIPNVRFPNALTITHYNDNGNASTYSVESGDPLVQRRFSLAKLVWLTHSGPKAGISTAAIQACFGLQWSSAKWRWEYVAADPGTSAAAPGAIKTLEQVAADNREPNFFELLNAGILQGSLGRHPGLGMDQSIAGGVGVYSSEFDLYKASPSLQILQIGANIIDQYDADSYPTAIRYDAFGRTGADDLSLQTAYGIENVPYLLGLFCIAIADPVPPGGGANGVLKSWVQPQIWNPHQVPSSTLSDYPSGFRGYAYGRLIPVWSKTPPNTLNFGPTTLYDDGFGVQGTPGNPGVIYFSDPGNATSPFYNNPCALTKNLTTSGGTLIVDQALTPSANYYDASKWSSIPDDDSPPNQFVGFSLAPDPNYNPDPNSDSVNRKLLLPDIASRVYFSLQYRGPDGSYHPYNFMARITQDQNQTMKHMKPSPELNDATIVPKTTVVGQTAVKGWGGVRLDPRTDRFSEATQWWSQYGTARVKTMNPSTSGYHPPSGSGATGNGAYSIPYLPAVFTYVPDYDPNAANPEKGHIELWLRNSSSYSVTIAGAPTNAYYADPDGVVRPADGYRGNTATGDGCELYHGNAVVSPTSTLTTLGSGSAQARRPVILNRPFRSVGELGFAYRDLPLKSLDFWSPTSGDGALLDLFSTTDEPGIAAGKINPNSAAASVLKAIVTGAFKSDALGVQISSTDAQTLSSVVAADVSANGPYGNRADLATRLGALVSGTGAAVAFNTTTTANSNWANKAYAEGPMRALADVANTRTWNLMIDVIAQTGRFAPNATTLNAFNVQGERRYWLHVAIDRFTGKVVDQQLEPVYE